MSEHTLDIPDLSGLPEGPWHPFKNPRGFGWSVADRNGSGICSQVTEANARAIAAIPAMIEQSKKLEAAWHDAEVSCDRLRSLNAEMLDSIDPDTLEAIADEIDCFEHSARAAGLRSLAKRQRASIAKAEGRP